MGLNDTPMGSRVHIAFFGRRNVGKSSLLNAVTGQSLAIVSDVKGTTTDPVYKSMELLPLGPVTIIDTPGMDDEGALGEMRVQKARQVLNKTDIAILVADAAEGLQPIDEALLSHIREKSIPHLVAYNKADALAGGAPALGEGEMLVSARTGAGVPELKERIAAMNVQPKPKRLVGDWLSPGDVVLLVTPIDSAAPKDRLILPQQQTIRDILDANAAALVVKETGLAGALARVKPRMVITDSQAFEQVAREVPEDIPLTSFSILMARRKGFLDAAVQGVRALDGLKDGDAVLVCEGCTHHRQCDDIGTVRLPRWMRAYTGRELRFEHASGGGFPDSLAPYALIVHCGGCMLNEREMRWRMACAREAGVPFTNYGMAIAHMKGILSRALGPLAGCAQAFPGV